MVAEDIDAGPKLRDGMHIKTATMPTDSPLSATHLIMLEFTGQESLGKHDATEYTAKKSRSIVLCNTIVKQLTTQVAIWSSRNNNQMEPC